VAPKTTVSVELLLDAELTELLDVVALELLLAVVGVEDEVEEDEEELDVLRAKYPPTATIMIMTITIMAIRTVETDL